MAPFPLSVLAVHRFSPLVQTEPCCFNRHTKQTNRIAQQHHPPVIQRSTSIASISTVSNLCRHLILSKSAACESTAPPLVSLPLATLIDNDFHISQILSAFYKVGLISAKLIQLASLVIPVGPLLTSWGLVHALHNAIPHPSIHQLESWLNDSFWRYFYWAVETAGPCYIKFVQWAGTRSDLFPVSVCFRFAKFHCSVAPHPFPYTAKVLKEAFGEDWEEKVWVEAKPVGAGCIAQVYRGFISENDAEGGSQFREVAMKVVHPGTRDALKMDLDIMHFIAKLTTLIPMTEFLAIPDTVHQFSTLMLPQLSLLTEAESLQQFKQNFAKSSSKKHMRRLKSRVVVPTVYPALCTPDLLVESFEDGMVLGRWMNLTRPDQTGEANEHEGDAWTSKGHFLEYLESSVDRESNHDPLASRPSFWGELKLRAPHLTATLHSWLCDQMDSIQTVAGDSASMLARLFGWKLQRSVQESAEYGMHAYWSLVANTGLAFFLQMMFVDNFVHADLHPGNLIIRFQKKNQTARKTVTERKIERVILWLRGAKIEDEQDKLLTSEDLKERVNKLNNKRSNSIENVFVGDFDDVDYEIALIDCGLTTSLSVREYCNFTDLLRCICTGDGYTAGKLILERARREACSDADAFCAEVDDIVQIYHTSSGGSLRLGETRIGEVLARVLRVACFHRVELDPRFASLIVAVVVLEGVGRQLDPHIDLLRAALPYLKDVFVDATIGDANMIFGARKHA